MTDYTTKDEFAAIDAEFHACYYKMRECLNQDLPITDEIEDAADRMFDIAIQLGDPLMLTYCLIAYGDFVAQHRAPPWSMLEHVKDAFRRCRLGGSVSMDSAFGLKQNEKGRPSRFYDRFIARTHSRVIEYFSQSMGVGKATEKAEELFEEADLRRTYSKYRRFVKSK